MRGIVSALSEYPTAGVQIGGRLLFSLLLFNLPKAPGVEGKGAQRDPLQVGGCVRVPPFPPGSAGTHCPDVHSELRSGYGTP